MNRSKTSQGRRAGNSKSGIGSAGTAAHEATGQMPVTPVYDEVLDSEKSHPTENTRPPRGETRRRTVDQPAGIADRRRKH